MMGKKVVDGFRHPEIFFKWADYAVQQENGVYWNDIGSAWTGTTVFLASALADALWFHGDLFGERGAGGVENAAVPDGRIYCVL